MPLSLVTAAPGSPPPLSDGPLRRWFTLPRWLVLTLGLLAALNLLKIGLKPMTVDRPIDFRVVWTGARLLAHRTDPYPDANLQAGWEAAVQTENLPSTSAPGRWGESFLYPPWAAALLAGTVAQLPWRVAFPLWYGLCLASLGLSVGRWWPRILHTWGAPALTGSDLLLVAFALKGTVPALLTGQPTFVAFALGTAALRLGQCGQFRTAGVLAGAAAFKVTLVLPFAALLLASSLPNRGWWRGLATALLTGGALTLAAVIMHPAGWHLLSYYGTMTAQVRAGVYAATSPDYPLGYQMISLTELGTALEFLVPGAWRGLTAVYAALVVVVGGWVWACRRHLNLLVGWCVAALLTLLVTYHLFYDALLLLPLVAWAAAAPRKRAAWVGVLAAPWFLPFNAILDALHAPVVGQLLYFSLPLSALGLLGLVLVSMLPQKTRG